MKSKDLLMCGVALLAGGAIVGISVGAFNGSKDEAPATSDTTTENLDLIDLIGDLQNQINTLKNNSNETNLQIETINNDLNCIDLENSYDGYCHTIKAFNDNNDVIEFNLYSTDNRLMNTTDVIAKQINQYKGKLINAYLTRNNIRYELKYSTTFTLSNNTIIEFWCDSEPVHSCVYLGYDTNNITDYSIQETAYRQIIDKIKSDSITFDGDIMASGGTVSGTNGDFGNLNVYNDAEIYGTINASGIVASAGEFDSISSSGDIITDTDIYASEGYFDTISVGDSEFTENDLKRNQYRYSFNLMHCANYVTSTTEFNNTNYLVELGDQFGYLYATLWTFYIDSSLYLTDNELSEIKTWSDIVQTFNIKDNYDYPMITYKGCYSNKNEYFDQQAQFHLPGINYTDSQNNGGICLLTEYNDASYISYRIMFQVASRNQNNGIMDFICFETDFDSDCLMVQDYSIVDKNL